ncbi:PadR family transcriptional regulator [Acrocarpospora phusangensis]|uniref:PadR family transcriptional regulator n=1 Tax=Acrocarpospora phusangensis TaxID=1070424 RepID=A0A919Q5N9_9ACTN|nr:helix-turn-helix transcriptional regulator [Acrocarpospora phusangensis]GIH21699.1 PadR family transcriptional regulator [Acrocarpospora phusangensis]
MPSAPRMTLQVQMVLREFLTDPAQERYGLELSAITSLPSGTIYPILARLEDIGWIESHWEEPDAYADQERPRRRYYKITRDGVESGREAIAKTYTSRRQSIPDWLRRPRSAGGPS